MRIFVCQPRLENFLRQVTLQFPIILLTGARQVGKTTPLRHLNRVERVNFTLDDPLVVPLV